MTDSRIPDDLGAGARPETAWWSSPDSGADGPPRPAAPTHADAVGPTQPDAPAQPGPATDPPAQPPRPAGAHSARRRTVALLAAGLLAGGAAGGGIGALVADHRTGSAPLAAGGITRSSATVVSSTAATVTGTPESAAAAIGSSVVTIEVSGTESATDNQSFGNGGSSSSQQVSDTGSGIVLRTDGFILTNNHVVSAAESGGNVHVTFSNGKTVAATIVGHDTTSDLAVIRVRGVSGLRAATLADSDALKVGQAVLAVGAPLGLANSVTQGIVSTLHRPVATGETGASAQSVIDAVQTDAAINPGNSGGALVDLAGRVVGINSAIASTGSSDSSTSQSGNIGVGFAIPSNDAEKVADQLITSGHATHAQIGISVGDATSSTDGAPGLGATVRQVTSGGGAADAGLRAGDIVTRVGTRTVTDADSLVVAVRAQDPGSKVTVAYTRGGTTRTVTVTLGSATSD